jgi:fructokinase
MNHPAKSVPLKVGIELGGTKCVMMLGTGPDDIRSEARIETVGPHRTMDAIDARLRQWSERHGFDAVGVASFGPLDLDPRSPTYGCVVNTPKPGWSGFDLLGPLRCWAVPVGFDTDVNGSALAEGRWGAAQGLASFAYVTVGTGIGVGSIIDGRSVRGLGHSEAGHLRIPRPPGSTFAGVCPFHGDCVEGLASGPAVLAHAGVPAEQLSTTDAAWEVVVSALNAFFDRREQREKPRTFVALKHLDRDVAKAVKLREAVLRAGPALDAGKGWEQVKAPLREDPAAKAASAKPMLATNSELLISFTNCPAPTSPTRTMRAAKLSNTRRASSNVSVSPPTMTVSLPAFAAGSPPLTGASSTRTLYATPCCATARAVSGWMVEWMAKTASVFITGNNRPAISRTSLSLTTHSPI